MMDLNAQKILLVGIDPGLSATGVTTWMRGSTWGGTNKAFTIKEPIKDSERTNHSLNPVYGAVIPAKKGLKNPKTKQLDMGEKSAGTHQLPRRIQRYSRLILSAIAVAVAEGKPEGMVVIMEKPGYRLQGFGSSLLLFYGHLITAFPATFDEWKTPPYIILEIAPKSLLKFACGNGNASKSESAQGIVRTWGKDLPEKPLSEDALDSFAMMKAGDCLFDKQGYTSDQRWGALGMSILCSSVGEAVG